MKRQTTYVRGPAGPYKRPRASTGPRKATLYRNPVMKITKPEKKTFDLINAAIGANLLTPLALITLGTLDNQRIGNKITVCNVNLRLTFASSIVAPVIGTPITIRISLILDKATNGVTPVYNDVFAGSGVNTFRNMDNVSRFVLLDDQTFDMSDFIITPAAAGNTFASLKFRTLNKSKLSIPCLYNDTVPGTPPVIGNVKTAMLYYVYGTTLPGTTVLTNSVIARVKYYDM